MGLILISPIFNFQNLKMTEGGLLPLIAEAHYVPTSVVITVCGNGIRETGELCDDGVNNGKYGPSITNKYCNTYCTGWAPYCGDGTTQSAYGEQCDDGNNVSGDGCRLDCKTEAPAGGGGGVIIPPPAPTNVIIQGKAYPLSSVTVLQDGRVTATTIADSQANFRVEITNITPGIWTFTIWAEDEEGRKSITFSFTASVTSGMATTVSGIFLPPTIAIDKTLVQRGETLNVLGITAPQSEVSIFVSSPQEIIKKTKAETDGTWFYPFDTTPLEEGSHTTRAKATSPEGLLSTFSNTLAFSVGKEIVAVIKKADINKDGKTNLVDFSILLYNWGIPKNLAADLNTDGKVNLVDFSIMLYYWTG